MTTHETCPDTASSEGTVTVTETCSGTYTQQITAGHHQPVADAPRPIGDDAGPSPYDLLSAALGACTSMTVRKYAARKGWLLGQVRVTLRHSRIHPRYCVECETSSGWIVHIDRTSNWPATSTTLNGNGCCTSPNPIHTLTSEVNIATSLQ
jgi:putative redox protein